MSISQADAEKVITKFQEDMIDAWKAKDLKKLTDLYHPDAVLICRGQFGVYGKEEISKKLETLVNACCDNYSYNMTYTSPAADGEYIFHKGNFKMTDHPQTNYQQIFKKTEDGKYLLYHDFVEA